MKKLKTGPRMVNLVQALSPGNREVHWRDLHYAIWHSRAENLTDQDIQMKLGSIISRTNRVLAEGGAKKRIVPGRIKRTYVMIDTK